MSINKEDLREVHFSFFMNPENSYNGLTDDTKWNGFDSIWIESDVLEAIKLDLADVTWPPEEDGLINLSGGYSTWILDG